MVWRREEGDRVEVVEQDYMSGLTSSSSCASIAPFLVRSIRAGIIVLLWYRQLEAASG